MRVRHVGELGAVVAVDDRGVALRPSSHTAQTDARRDQLRLKLRQAFFWDRQDAPGMRLRRPHVQSATHVLQSAPNVELLVQ